MEALGFRQRLPIPRGYGSSNAFRAVPPFDCNQVAHEFARRIAARRWAFGLTPATARHDRESNNHSP